MKIIVSDTSCLIDLKKGGLLEAFLGLPFDLVIPDVIFQGELLSFTRAEKALIKRSMTVAKLDSDGVARAVNITQVAPALSSYDAFAFVTAEERPGSILLTGDRRLRVLAENEDVEVHGVLWVVDRLFDEGKTSRSELLEATTIWKNDSSVRLPRGEIDKLRSRLK
jgi:predicted nucleic acid-binding protein